MESETRQIIADACAQADRAREQYEQWQGQHEREQLKRRSNAGLVYKTHIATAVTQPQPQQVAVMDDATSKAWNEWFDGRATAWFDQFMDELIPVMGEVISEIRFQLRNELAAEAKALREEISGLRAELNETKVLEWPRKQNVA